MTRRDPDQAVLVDGLDAEEDDEWDLSNPEPEPPEEEREEMVDVVEEAENGLQLLRRPWDEDTYWQVVDPEGSGPRRVGSPNGGCLYAKDDEERARRYFAINARVPQDTDHTSVPGYIAAAGKETVVEWLYAYRRYDVEELARRTGLAESEVKRILDGGDDG